MLRVFFPFSRFFLLFLFLLLPFSIALRAEKKELCHYRFHLPSETKLISQKQNYFIAQTKPNLDAYDVKFQWIFACDENLRRTSRGPHIMKTIQERGQLLHYHEELELDQDLPALLLSRTRIKKGRRLRSLDVYFSSRNYVYRFYAIALHPKQLPTHINKKLHLKILTEMKALLKNGKFSKKMEKTITEEEFQLRLYLMIALFVLLALSLISIFLWKIYRGKK